MRNLIGYAAAAVAAGAVSLFAAAGFADQHSESFVGQCFQNVRCLCCGQGVRAVCPKAMPAAALPCVQDPSTESSCPTIKFEPSSPSSSRNRLPGAIVIHEEESTGAEPCDVPEQARILMNGLARLQNPMDLCVEESTPAAAPFMPYCEDDEPAPAVMPYVEGSHLELNKALEIPTSMEFPTIKKSNTEEDFKFWLGFFRQPNAVPECKEDPAMHQQYPGVPSSVSPKPSKANAVPFEEELQEVSPLPKFTPDFRNLLKRDGTLGDPKKHSHLDTTECRPSDFGFDNLGLRPF